MFRTVYLPIIRSFSLYIQQWYMLYRFADSLLASFERSTINIQEFDIQRTVHRDIFL